MPSRRYMQKSVKELAAIFANGGKNEATRRALLHELSYRKTDAARQLRRRVEAADLNHRPARAPDDLLSPGAILPSPRIDQPGLYETAAPILSDSHLPPAAIRSTFPRPRASEPQPIINRPDDILRAWTALEVLSPKGFQRRTELVGGDTRRLAVLDRNALPWTASPKSIPGKRLYFEVILGTLGLPPAVEALLQVYADVRPDRPGRQGRTIIASILVDKEGLPLDGDEALAVSSFAWGMPVALLGDLSRLADWRVVERHLKSELRRRLFLRDEDGKLLPLSRQSIDMAYHYLVDTLGLAGHDVAEPDFALRRYEYFASKVPPETSILNSFFLADLERARAGFASGAASEMLRIYLGDKRPRRRIDLLDDQPALRELLRPASTPAARWPAPGCQALALLQQAAVNGASLALREGGVVAVNGPPGTGKTTLLRDIVAARIVERAEVMAAFDDPARAFTRTPEVLQRQGSKLTLHRVSAKLRGFEMVVASANNRAVENVSAELPVLAAVSDELEELRYFKSIADRLFDRDCWGMIAAVLGNSNNRITFADRVWRDEEHGLRTYLAHAAGSPQMVVERGPDGQIEERCRAVVEAEAPPADRHEARHRWQAARTAFAKALATAREIQRGLDHAHRALIALPAIEQAIEALHGPLAELAEQLANAERRFAMCQETLGQSDDREAVSVQAVQEHRAQRPGLLARLLGTHRASTWVAEQAVLADEETAARKARRAADAAATAAAGKIEQYSRKLEAATGEHAKLCTQRDRHRACLHAVSARPGVTLPDDGFLGRPHAARQVSSLWFDPEANAARDRVFATAMTLHRAFVDCAADPIRQNLTPLMENFGTRSLGTASKDSLIEELWATLFLVVPVVSTTFASVERMFSRVGAQALGWLLIDEAGQAPPQAAVGALLRAKRTVVVGDPMQIEPVVALPDTLTEQICRQFGVDSRRFDAPSASVQTLADAASPFFARFPDGICYREVGAPLLVHRRCDSPMFEISSSIAYANLMVQAKEPGERQRPLGPSRWIDVQGSAGQDKWCAAEGDEVLRLLQELRNQKAPLDLYVITPFVDVQHQLRRMIDQSNLLAGWPHLAEDWTRTNVGTVHTVQGREADTVFFVLGAQAPAQGGARAWAATKPNLLNVAVSRARSSFYVIGNRQLWSEIGHFKTLSRLLG